MKLKIYIPPDKSLPYDSIRLAYATSEESKMVTTPPFGKPVLLLFINPDSVNNYSNTSQGVLLGQHTHPLMLNLNENFKVLALHLKPYAIKQLFNIDASLLTNKYTSIHQVPLLESFYEKVLANIEDEKQLINEINTFFYDLTLFPVSYEVASFLKYLNEHEVKPISEMVMDIGLSERNLERKFKSEVGLTPKKYLQIQRVFKVFEQLNEDADWQQIVVDYQYSDQSHLIHEFKKYAAIAPGLYVKKGLTIAKQLPPVSDFEL